MAQGRKAFPEIIYTSNVGTRSYRKHYLVMKNDDAFIINDFMMDREECRMGHSTVNINFRMDTQLKRKSEKAWARF